MKYFQFALAALLLSACTTKEFIEPTPGNGSGSTIQFNTSLTYGTVTDFDGNVYKTIQIGSQVWMAENLRVAHYNNGDPIPNITANSQWANASSGAWCYYNNNSQFNSDYGKLYNWYAASDSRGIAPAGWHVPNINELITLSGYLGGTGVAGGRMKEAGTTHWQSPSASASNSSGFTALPGGFRDNVGDGAFYEIYQTALFWSCSSTISPYSGNLARLRYSVSGCEFLGFNKTVGMSIRCIKD